VPAGTFRVVSVTVTPDGGPKATYQLESAAPFRVVRWAADDGEEAVLTGCARKRYWEMNGPGGEAHLKDLGLAPPRPEVPR